MSKRRWVVGLTLAGTIAFGLAYAHPRHKITAVEHTLSEPQWQGPPLRLALVADLHFSRPDDLERLSTLAEAIAQRQPDLILLAGDYAGELALLQQHSRSEIAQRMAAAFTPIAPTVAVLGNHDNWDSPAEWAAAVEATPIQLVEGRVAELRLAGEAVCVRGLGDFYSRAWSPVEIPARCEGRTLTLTHDPMGALKTPGGTAQTPSFAGHTHCGQIAAPLLGPIKVPTQAPEAVHCGAWELGQVGVTTGGIGTSIVPMRFGPGTAPRWEDIRLAGPQ